MPLDSTGLTLTETLQRLGYTHRRRRPGWHSGGLEIVSGQSGEVIYSGPSWMVWQWLRSTGAIQ